MYMFYGFTKFIYNRLPYFRYDDNANNDISRAEGGTAEAARTSESGQSSQATGEGGSETSVKITSEEVRLDGVEQIDTYASPTPSTPNSPRASSHITVTTGTSTRSGEIYGYNERTGECVVQDSHGNLILVRTCGNPFKNHTR